MKMTINTAAKIRNLQAVANRGVILTHADYDRLFKAHNVPGWGTLKAHNLIREVRREVRISDDEVFTTTPEWEKVTVYYVLEV